MSGAFGYALGDALLAVLDQAPVILGPVAFEGHEVPSRISIGGAQAVRIHRLPGGGRIIDAMGVDDGAISWRGFFTGPFAAARARLVDTMRQGGQLVGLSFGDYAFNVVVVHFEYDLQDRGALISYRIRTEIVPDGTIQVADTAVFIAATLLDDIANASGALVGFGQSGTSAALVGVTTALALPGGPTSAITLAAGRVALQASGTAIMASIQNSGRSLPGSFGIGGSGTSSAAGLMAAVAAAGSLAAATQAGGYVNRSSGWLDQLAGQPRTTPIIFA